jgi:hypothetical protein
MIVAKSLNPLERVLKIDRERDCESGGADGEAARNSGQLLSVLTRRGRIFERNL